MNMISTDSLIVMAKVFWPLLVIVAVLPFFIWKSHRRTNSIKMEEIDKMDGKTFEEFLGTVFKNLGYKVEVTRYSGDYGADLIVQKHGKRIAVQAKRYSSNLGVDAIKEVYAAQKYYRCKAAMVVTNSDYREQAKKLARATNVVLWNGEKLNQVLTELNKKGKGVDR